MTKLVVAKLKGSKKAKAAHGAVTEKRVRSSTGQFLTVRTIEGQSKTFAHDLTYVFTKNVAKARRENKAVAGVTDRAPSKA